MDDQPTANSELLIDFRDESLDLLNDLPTLLADHQQNPSDSESINQVFRAVHTIKGNAGFFGLVTLKNFAHTVEDVLDLIREGKITLDQEGCRCLVESFDVLSEIVVRDEEQSELNADEAALLDRVAELCRDAKAASPQQKLLSELVALADEMATSDLEQGRTWSDRLRRLTKTVDTAGETALRNTGEDGDLTAGKLMECRFAVDGDDVTEYVVPLIDMFVRLQEQKYAKADGTAFLETADKFASFLESKERKDLSTMLLAARDDFNTIFRSPIDMDELLASIVWEQLQPLFLSLRAKAAAAETVQDSSPGGEQTPKQPADSAAKSRFLRVREERVDQFLDDVARLFITCERLKDLQTRMAREFQTHDLVEELRQINAALNSQSTDLQRSVVELRKVPARGLFSKFPRVARSLATKLGKQLDVHLSGEEIEIDKSLVEDLDGPLMHMVRNVCDHGIETPQEREARGRPAVGNLWMKCELTKTHVVITIEDDGRGIDPDRLRRKAVERGMYTAPQAEALSDQQAIALIFDPGFSTAEQISDVSGRGVGLDVVRTQLAEHDGDVTVDSVLGRGTKFQLSIPIRRAVVVLEGLLIRQGGGDFVLPFEHIQEIIQLGQQSVSTVGGRPVVRMRGEPYAAVPLAEVLGENSDIDLHRLTGVLIRVKGGQLCLMAETVLGRRKVVVNPINQTLACSNVIAGVAQLGGGKLALVLDAAEIIQSMGAETAAPPKEVKATTVERAAQPAGPVATTTCP